MKKDRKEYMKEYYLKHRNPNAKKYEHKTEEEKKEYHRMAQKKHYNKYKERIKEKRMEKYYNKEFIHLIKNNKQEIIGGMICYHITNRTAKKLLQSDVPHTIIGYNRKLYVSFNERR